MPTLKQSGLRLVERLSGFHLVRRRHSYSWPEKDFVRRLFDHLRVDCVFDVGANAGQYGRYLRACGFEGTIISFEPNPAAFAKLAAAAAADRAWHCEPVALGAATSTMGFNVMKSDDFSSFRTPMANAKADFRDMNVVDHVVDVSVLTVDEVYAGFRDRLGFSRPFMKLDTQGYDLQVLRGAKATIANFVGLLSEVSIIPIYEDAPTMFQSIEAFSDFGFDIVELFDVHAQHAIRRTIEMNCYSVRADLL